MAAREIRALRFPFLPLPAAILLLSGLSGPASGQDPCVSWTPGFHYPGVDATVHDSIIYDDGTGPALYLGGEFKSAFGKAVNHVARWNGTRVSDLDGGLDDHVYCFVPFDDESGNGPRLFAGGDFRNGSRDIAFHVARWNGTRWVKTTHNGGLDGTVWALEVFDDGNGPRLHAGGDFRGTPNRIAVWDGIRWNAVGGGVNGRVEVLMVFDDGTGPALYAGGSFQQAGGIPVNFVARWDGVQWTAVGGGMNSAVRDLAVFDDGSGPALYATGSFDLAGGVPAVQIAKWDGQSWSALGSGLVGILGGYTLAVHDDGSGEALYVGGVFTDAGGVPANNIARWDGSNWTAVGGPGGSGRVYSLTEYDDGSGPALWMGGTFSSWEDQPGYVVKWDGSAFLSVDPTGNAPVTPFRSFAVVDYGQGPRLVGGLLGRFGEADLNHVGEWDGSTWQALPGDPSQTPNAFAVYDDGTGPALFAGGQFPPAGPTEDFGVARWDGADWIAIGENFGNIGCDFPPCRPTIHVMTVFDDGTGEALYVGGDFFNVDGVSFLRVGRWNGVSWSPVGEGFNEAVEAFAVFDDGTGESLYAAGRFFSSGPTSTRHIARWTGTDWVPVGSGIDFPVRSLCVFDDGSGSRLYAAGLGVGDVVVRWDGISWTSVGDGFNQSVHGLTVHDDGNGPALYAGGFFTASGSTPIRGLARWDGVSWSEVASGVEPALVREIVSYDDGAGPALFVTGSISSAGEVGSVRFARYGPTNLPLRAGNVNTGALSDPVEVLFLNGHAGDVVRRELTVPAGQPSVLSIDRAPAPGSPAQYALWILDGAPDDLTCVPIDFQRNNGNPEVLGFGPRCLATSNTVTSGSCPCPLTFPTGLTSKGLGPAKAAALCLHPGPGMPRAPASFMINFPAGTYTIGALLSDNAAPNPIRASVTNWLVVTAE